jgi:hypothetical protein
MRNRGALRRAVRRCTGQRIAFGRGSQWVKVSPDGRSLAGVSRTQVTVFGQLPVVQTVVSRLDGRLGTLPPAPVLKRGLRVCSPGLQLRCTLG